MQLNSVCKLFHTYLYLGSDTFHTNILIVVKFHEFCRVCRVTTAKNNQRVMCSNASSGIVEVWQEIVEKTVHQLGKDILLDSHGEKHISYLWWKCYRSLEKYKKLQASLVSNMEKPINARESVSSQKHLRMEALSDDEIYSQGAKHTQPHPSVSVPLSRVRKGSEISEKDHLCSTYRGLWGLVVVQVSWLSGRALVAQARGVVGLTPGSCWPFHFSSIFTS